MQEYETLKRLVTEAADDVSKAIRTSFSRREMKSRHLAERFFCMGLLPVTLWQARDLVEKMNDLIIGIVLTLK